MEEPPSRPIPPNDESNDHERRKKYMKFDFFQQNKGTIRATLSSQLTPEKLAYLRSKLRIDSSYKLELLSSEQTSSSEAKHAIKGLVDDDPGQKMAFLKGIGAEAFCSSEELHLVAKQMRAFTMKKHRVICREGQEANCFFFVVKGEVICNCGLNDVRSYRRPHTKGLVESGAIFEEGITVVLGPMSVVGEDLVLPHRHDGRSRSSSSSSSSSTPPSHDLSQRAPLKYDVTCIAYSETVLIYAVPCKLFPIFARATVLSRSTALVEKVIWIYADEGGTVKKSAEPNGDTHYPTPEAELDDPPKEESPTDPAVKEKEEGTQQVKHDESSFYGRLNSVRGMIAILKPNRGMLLSCYGSSEKTGQKQTSSCISPDRNSKRNKTLNHSSSSNVTDVGEVEPPKEQRLRRQSIQIDDKNTQSYLDDNVITIMRERLKLNYRGTEKVKRAYQAYQQSLKQVQQAARSNTRRFLQNMKGSSLLDFHLQQLWTRNPRAWRTITKDKPPEDLSVVKEPEKWRVQHERHTRSRERAQDHEASNILPERAQGHDQAVSPERARKGGLEANMREVPISSMTLQRLPSLARFNEIFLHRRKVRHVQKDTLDDIMKRCDDVLVENVDAPADYVVHQHLFERAKTDALGQEKEKDEDDEFAAWAMQVKQRRVTLKNVARKTITVLSMNKPHNIAPVSPMAEVEEESSDEDEAKKGGKGAWNRLRKVVQTQLKDQDENEMMKRRAKLRMALEETWTARREIEKTDASPESHIKAKGVTIQGEVPNRRKTLEKGKRASTKLHANMSKRQLDWSLLGKEEELKAKMALLVKRPPSTKTSLPKAYEEDSYYPEGDDNQDDDERRTSTNASSLANLPPLSDISLDPEEENSLWHEYKRFHLYQVISYYRDQKSFPVVGPSTFALLWKRKMTQNPGVRNLLKDLKEESYEQLATEI